MEAISNRQIEQMIDDIFIKQDRITLCTTGVQPGPAPENNQPDAEKDGMRVKLS